MSVQSSSCLDNQNSPIWQNKDLDPSLTSIVYVNKAFNLCEDPVARLNTLTKRSIEIEQETGCTITIHGQASKTELIWIKIKGESMGARKQALKLINENTNNACFEVILPNLNEEKIEPTRLSSPSPPQSPRTKSATGESNAKQKSSSTATNQSSSNSLTKDLSNKRKSTMTRSSTENVISSLQSKNSFTSPFSVLLPQTLPLKEELISNKTMHPILESDKDDETDENLSQSVSIVNEANKKPTKKYRYSLDFLLLRADMPDSKRLPNNWKELNEKYPLICFCGKVLSYFNPYKYHEHWEKTKAQNYELHQSNFESAKLAYQKKPVFRAQTDDYLNVKNTLRDFQNTALNVKNRANDAYKSFNYNTAYNGNYIENGFYNKKQSPLLPFEMRQFQSNTPIYQQENQMKRKQTRAYQSNSINNL